MTIQEALDEGGSAVAASTQNEREAIQTLAALAIIAANGGSSLPGTNGKGYDSTTSATSLAIGTGTKSFTTQSGKAYIANASRVRLASAADAENFMSGVVTSYSGTSMTVLVDEVGGSGTLSDWNISIAGRQGDTGPQGPGGGTASDVQYVATSANLAASTAPIVITTGYSVAGDGGHGIYRSVAGSSATVDGVRVFTRTAAGRYILQNTGTISAKQAGAAGDGSTDDNARLQALFNACVGLTALIDPLTFLSEGQLTIPSGVRVVASGATLNIETTGSECGVDMLSNTIWDGGTVNVLRQSGGVSGNDHCPFRIGDYLTSPERQNVTLRNVTISCDWDSDLSCGILVVGLANNVLVQNVVIPSSATLRTGIGLHWGFVSNADPENGTKHPYNIRVSNISVGELTCPSGEGSPITVSACYDVAIENVCCKQARYAMIGTCGDYGFRYSGLETQNIGSVCFKNVTCERCYLAGVLNTDIDSQLNPLAVEHVFDNCTLIGTNNGGGLGGIYFSTGRNTTFRNCVFSGFEQGTVFSGATEKILFDACTFALCRVGGIVIDESLAKDITITNCKIFKCASGLSGNGAAGIILTNGTRASIRDCIFGDSVSETGQEVGVSVAGTFVGAVIDGCRVRSVKSGGANYGFYLGSGSDFGNVALFGGNTVASGITLLSGPINVPIAIRGLNKTYTGTASNGGVPVNGTYVAGDQVNVYDPGAGPSILVNTVGGSPGTWVSI